MTSRGHLRVTHIVVIITKPADAALEALPLVVRKDEIQLI